MAGRGGGRGAAPAGRGGGRGGSSNGHFGGKAAPAQAGVLLPFAAGQRSVTECMARYPGFVSDDLQSMTLGSVKAGAVLSQATGGVALGKKDVAEGVVAPVAAEEAKPGGVSVRAFLAGSIRAAGRGHVLSKIPVVAQRAAAGGGIAAYGGSVPKGKADAAMVASLKKMVKEQSGLDLAGVKTWDKLAQFDYGSGESTVFFAPNLKEAGKELAVMAQATETSEEVEVEEKYEEEEEIEVEKDGKKVKEMKKVKKTRKVKKTEVSRDVAVRATEVSVGTLAETRVSKSTPAGHADLIRAAAAYAELLQRDAASAVIGVLKEKTKEAEKARAEREAEAEKVAERKRKRSEAVGVAKKARAEKEETLRAEWKEEDEGMTDAEKRDAKKTRADAIAALATEERDEVKKVNEEHNKIDAEATKEPEKDPSKPKTKTVWETNQDMYHLFQILDCPSGGLATSNNKLDREYLAKKLLCLGSSGPASLKAAFSLTTLGGTAPRASSLDYGYLAKVSKEIELPPTPKKEEKEETKEEDDQAES